MDTSITPLFRILSDRYAFIILEQVCQNGTCRFNNLEQHIPGISTRTLTLRLNQLVKLDILTRCRYREKPPRVEYCLTKKGREFQSLISHMSQWSKRHLPLGSTLAPSARKIPKHLTTRAHKRSKTKGTP